MGLNGEKNSGLVVIKRYLGKFDHDRTCSPEPWNQTVCLWEIIPIHGRKIHISEIL